MRSFTLVLISFVACILHIALSPVTAIFTAKIDFIMISVVLIALFTENWYSPVLCAVYSGLAVDILTQPSTFINTGIYLFVSLLASAAVKIFRAKSFATAGLGVLCAVGVKHLLYVFVLYVMRLSSELTLATFFRGIPSALYSAVIAVGMYFVYKCIFDIPFMQEKNENEGNFLG